MKDHFINKLIEVIGHEDIAKDIIYGDSALSFYTLIKIGESEKAILNLNLNGFFHYVYKLIEYMINSNFIYFDSNELRIIKEKVQNSEDITSVDFFRSNRKTIVRKIDEIRFQNLTKNLIDSNVEINKDKAEVINKFELFGFRKEYADLLNDLDKFIVGESSKYDLAGAINCLRELMINIFKDIVNLISEKTGDHPKDKSTGILRSFVKEKLDFTDRDNDVYDSIVSILHSEGGHSFSSSKKYFRLSRNMAIEVILLLLSKYEERFEGAKKDFM